MKQKKKVYTLSKQTELRHCPKCKGRLNGVTGLSHTDRNPTQEPGDMTFCFYCCALLRMDESRNYELVPESEKQAYIAMSPLHALIYSQICLLQKVRNATSN